jgi:hypothetical protein
MNEWNKALETLRVLLAAGDHRLIDRAERAVDEAVSSAPPERRLKLLNDLRIAVAPAGPKQTGKHYEFAVTLVELIDNRIRAFSED